MIELPKYKGKLIPVGSSSKAVIVPAKMREDYGVEDDTEYWIEMCLVPIGGDADGQLDESAE